MAVYSCEKRPDGSLVHHGPCETCGQDVPSDGKTDDVQHHHPTLGAYVNHDLMLDGVRTGTVRYGACNGARTWSYSCATCDPVGLPKTRKVAS